MPSLRQRMTTYLRQLSFINEPREDAQQRNRQRPIIHPGGVSGADDGCFVSRYLDGRLVTKPKDAETEINHGKEPDNLPDLKLFLSREYPQTLTAACTGPDEGLASIRRSRLHLSAGPEIDFIDTITDQEPDDDEIDIRRSATKKINQRRSISIADPNANPIHNESGSNNKHQQPTAPNNVIMAKPKNVTINIVVSTISTSSTAISNADAAKTVNQKVIISHSGPPNDNESHLLMGNNCDSSKLLHGKHTEMLDWAGERSGSVNWKLENDHAYGLSVSLYEKNSVTDERIGDPIADCYGLMVRGQSAVMAMADGVNWGKYNNSVYIYRNIHFR